MIEIFFATLLFILIFILWIFLMATIKNLGVSSFFYRNIIIILLSGAFIYLFNQYAIQQEKKMFPEVITLKKNNEIKTIMTGSNSPISIPFLHYCRKISVDLDADFKSKWKNEHNAILNQLKNYSDSFKYQNSEQIIFTKESTPNLSPFPGYDEVFAIYKIDMNNSTASMIYCNYDNFREIPDMWL